eukprot:CAMPEP_0170102850 /NCGR_PEP_ID=MMETSP0020_2-20130122/3125_1 /TAXON_ID=98059 /ORGANISM="Dinobryon sp., Strain UTEXLB2267" /LENGTH=1395 /DNA_ID=CAMNT_0010326267 /DNA_START=600 /DNA_END=4788 /DNA_ORIENTATION=-
MEYSSHTSIIVLGPSSSIKPIPVIISPSKISPCNNLSFDLSASKGSGGRAWSSISILVNSSILNGSDVLQRFLNSIKVFSPPIPIPYYLLKAGYSYEFTFRLCNFLGSCGESSVTVIKVNDTIPSITLPGELFRTSYRNRLLTVISATSLPSCTSSSSSGILDYEWSIYTNGVKVFSIVSISRDKTKFILPPYSLTANTTYSIEATVSIRGSFPLQSSSASIEINVLVGNIRAVIDGGLTQNMRVLTTLDIDASGSYDEDKFGLSGVDADLDFYWSCSQINPSFAADCTKDFTMKSLGSVLRVQAAKSSAGNIYQVELAVASRSDLRVSRMVITISVLSASSIIVNTMSNSPATINPSQLIQLNGIILVPSDISNVSALWTVDDPSISLNQIASSPVHSRLSSSSNTNYLVLLPNTLIGGLTLTFTLSCFSVLNEFFASSSVIVMTNSAPKPGTFVVSPPVGTELKDMFLFNAQQWMDTDLPLYYQFEYLSSTGSVIVLQSRSVLSFGHSQLPASSDSTSNAVITLAQIFDDLNANSSTSFAVTVHKGPALSLTEMMSFISSMKNQSFHGIDDVKKMNALSLYLINSVNCSQAPNCSALNRKNCIKTTNTCGLCKSNAYVGDSFDSNSPCFLPDIATKVQLSCKFHGDCIDPKVCLNQSCVFPSKYCTDDCSGHGICVFKDLNTGTTVEQCSINNEQCISTCNCDDDYSGSLWCNLRKSDQHLKQEMRKQAIDNVNYLIAQEYPDQFAIPGWISILVDATKNSDELNDQTMSEVLKTTDSIVEITVQSSETNDVLSGLFAAVNSATTYVANRPSKVVTGGIQIDMNSVLNRTMSTIMSITTALADTLVFGQVPIQSSQTTFKATAVKLSASIYQTMAVSLPQSQSETLLHIPTSSILLTDDNVNERAEPIAMSIVSFRSSFYQNGTNFKANPLTIYMSNSPCSGSNSSCTLDLHLTNSRSVSDGNYSTMNDIIVHCRKGLSENVKRFCLNGRIVDTMCNGTYAGVLKYPCPPTKVTTTCATLSNGNPANLINQVCTLTKTFASYSICSCNLNAIQHGSRKLLLPNTSSQSVELSVATLLNSVLESSKSTVLYATELNESHAQKEWTVLLTLGLIIAVVAVCMFVGHQFDAQVKNKIDPQYAVQSLSQFNFNGKNKLRERRLAELVQKSDADELTLIEESLPRVLAHQQPFAERFTVEVKQHHRWLGVACFYSDSFPRSLRVLSLASNIIVMLFVQSITYNLTKPDDGSCGIYETSSACQQPQSAGGSKCAWNNGHCDFIEHATGFTVVVFVALLSAIVSTPVAYFQSYLIYEYLAAPTSLTSIHDDACMDIYQRKNLSLFAQSFSSTDSKNVVDDNIIKKTFGELSAAIKDYRQTLLSRELHEFDRKNLFHLLNV